MNELDINSIKYYINESNFTGCFDEMDFSKFGELEIRFIDNIGIDEHRWYIIEDNVYEFEKDGKVLGSLAISEIGTLKSECMGVSDCDYAIKAFNVEEIIKKTYRIVTDSNSMNELLNQNGELTPSASRFIFLYKEKMKELAELEEKFNGNLMEEMKKRGITSYKDENISITLTPETERGKFDSKAFKSRFPDIYEKFVKKTKVKGSIRVTLKKGITSKNMVQEVHPTVEKLPVIEGGEW